MINQSKVIKTAAALVRAFDQLDRDAHHTLLNGIGTDRLFQALISLIMRVAFLSAAENAQLWPINNPAYQDHYAVSTLARQLRADAAQFGVDALATRITAWPRLLVAFEIIYHGNESLLAYRGRLFDPARDTFLSSPACQIDDRIVLQLLSALSSPTLDAAKLGKIFEELLDFTVMRADTTLLGLSGLKDSTRAVSLDLLSDLLHKTDDLIEYLHQQTKRSRAAIKNGLAFQLSPAFAARLLAACDYDAELMARIKPFAGLLRLDAFGAPIVIAPDCRYLAQIRARRASGSHYTPEKLAKPLVQHTLAPLVYHGPAIGLPKDQWRLRSSQEILALKICDITMGAGSFLAEACRYLSARLVEAWAVEAVQLDPQSVSADAAKDLTSIRLIEAQQAVVEYCLYGVDINPLAVEVAKLSLWLLTKNSPRPFTFLDHAFKCGDALLGIIDIDQLNQLHRRFSNPHRDAAPAIDNDRRLLADQLIARALMPRSSTDHQQVLTDRRPFHWFLEFPELFDGSAARRGFDAIIGNPPFIGGQKISGLLGRDYRNYLIRELARDQKGSADLSAYTLLRAGQLLNCQGYCGLLATNTIAQGDTREVGLDQLINNGLTIIRAVSSYRWPGAAKLEIAQIWLKRGEWHGQAYLDEQPVAAISTLLTAPADNHRPVKLTANANRAFQGSIVLGMGFTLSAAEAHALITRDEKNRAVVQPFLNGAELNSRFDQRPTRWVINFQDWPLDRDRAPEGYCGPVAADYPDCLEIVREKVKPTRDRLSHGDINARDRARRWWQFARPTRNLYRAMTKIEKVIVVAATSRTLAFVMVNSEMVFSHATYVFRLNGYGEFGLLQSVFHDLWAREYGSTIKGDLRYTPTDIFETFPFPREITDRLKQAGERYHQLRAEIMERTHEGLTVTYQRFHNPKESSDEICELRKLQIELDLAVAEAYCWPELKLGHDFYQVGKRSRFTISQTARVEILARLVELNRTCKREEKQLLMSQMARSI